MKDLNEHGIAGLKKYDMKVSGIVFMIYCLVAAGAFGIEEMIPASGPGLTIIMLLIFPMIWALPISNMVAEMGAILPSEGGAYVWVREALGEFWGFQAGWWGTVSTYITNGAYVVLVVGYLGRFFEMTELQADLIKIAMILLFTFINLMGVREVSKVSTVLSIIVLISFAALAVVGFANWNYNPMTPLIPEGQGVIESIGGCISICIWMYCGYECISNLAGEVKNPQVIPKGLIIAMPLIAATYVLPTIGSLAAIGHWQQWSVSGQGTYGYSAVFMQYGGPIFGMIFLGVAVISQCSIFNTYIASGSRGFFVLADDNLCPKFLVKVSKKRGVPYVGIISLSIVTMILSKFDFATLVKAEVVFILVLYMTLSITVIVLRKKIPLSEREGLFIIPFGKVGLYLFTALPFTIAAVTLLLNGTVDFIVGLAATMTGPIAYIILKKIYGGRYKIDPIAYPINKKTKLCEGDLGRISAYCIILGVFATIGSYGLVWYEGKGAVQNYLEEYGSGFFSNFHGMISTLQYGGVIAVIIGIILFIMSKKVEFKKVELNVEQELVETLN